MQYSICRNDGEVRHVEDYGREVFDEERGATMLEGVVRDVTEREWAQEALLQAEKRYRTPAEQLPVVVYNLTLSRRTVSWAPRPRRPSRI